MGFSPFTQGLQALASTGPAGFALQNATPNIITWTAPSDGQMHRVLVFLEQQVTSLETGGGVDLTFTDASNTVRTFNKFAGGLAAGNLSTFDGLNVLAGTTVTVVQHAALTGGAAKIWGEIWGS